MAKKLKSNWAAKRRVFQKYKERANKSNISFNISKRTFITITQQNCYYCGIAPSNTMIHRDYYVKSTGERKVYTYNKPFIYNGVDRVDNNKGYFKRNCVSCCAICNRAKYRLSISEFYKWIERIKVYERQSN